MRELTQEEINSGAGGEGAEDISNAEVASILLDAAAAVAGAVLGFAAGAVAGGCLDLCGS
jgi:hypothetical protein